MTAGVGSVGRDDCWGKVIGEGMTAGVGAVRRGCGAASCPRAA